MNVINNPEKIKCRQLVKKNKYLHIFIWLLESCNQKSDIGNKSFLHRKTQSELGVSSFTSAFLLKSRQKSSINNLPHGWGLLTISRSNRTRVICSWIDSWLASANKYKSVHEKYCVWLLGYRNWLAMQFKNRYRPSVSRSTAKFWKMSMCEEWAMADIVGVKPFVRKYWMAEVPTYITKALISCMLYLLPGDSPLASWRWPLTSDKKVTGVRFFK